MVVIVVDVCWSAAVESIGWVPKMRLLHWQRISSGGAFAFRLRLHNCGWYNVSHLMVSTMSQWSVQVSHLHLFDHLNDMLLNNNDGDDKSNSSSSKCSAVSTELQRTPTVQLPRPLPPGGACELQLCLVPQKNVRSRCVRLLCLCSVGLVS